MSEKCNIKWFFDNLSILGAFLLAFLVFVLLPEDFFFLKNLIKIWFFYF